MPLLGFRSCRLGSTAARTLLPFVLHCRIAVTVDFFALVASPPFFRLELSIVALLILSFVVHGGQGGHWSFPALLSFFAQQAKHRPAEAKSDELDETFRKNAPR